MINLGEVIDNHTLMTLFKCGNSGGMRRSKATNSLVLIVDHTKPFYKDTWENNNVLHYTGMGKFGDQDLQYKQNKTLNESRTNGIELHLFEVYEPNKYQYKGEVYLSEAPFQSKQKDEEGKIRNVWIFPLRVKSK